MKPSPSKRRTVPSVWVGVPAAALIGSLLFGILVFATRQTDPGNQLAPKETVPAATPETTPETAPTPKNAS